MRDLPLDAYYTIQQFHKWYAAKLELPGFDAESQNNFQKYLENINDEGIKNLSVEEIIGLKEAIARDVEAINFVIELYKILRRCQKCPEQNGNRKRGVYLIRPRRLTPHINLLTAP